MGQTLPSCPSTADSNQPPLQPNLCQYRDKGLSTNKAVTSTLLLCCPNEPTRPGTCAAAIWDIQNRGKKKFPSLVHVLVINKPPLYRVPDIYQFYWHEICRQEMAIPNPDGSLVGRKTASGSKAALQPRHGNKRSFL